MNPGRVSTTTSKGVGKKQNQLGAMKKLLATKGKPKAKKGQGIYVPMVAPQMGQDAKMKAKMGLFGKK